MKRVLFLWFGLSLATAITAQNNANYELKRLSIGYEDHYENSLTRNEGKLYETPDTNSKVVWQHQAAYQTSITPLLKTYNQGIKWYKVITDNEREGFLREQDFVKYSFFGNNGAYYNIENNPDSFGYPNYSIIRNRVRAENNLKRKEKLTDTFHLGSAQYYLRAKSRYADIALKGVETLFHFEFFNASCPGTNEVVLVADVGDSLTIIASSFGQGEAGWSVNRNVYIPVRFGNGKVLLVANGDVETIFNHNTAELNTFNYPENIGVPIEELVVVVKEEYEPIEADRQDAESAYDPETKRTLYQEEYYRWKNNKLILVKTIKK